MAIQIQVRHDTAANWTAANPILAIGELGVEEDTHTFKIGNGATAWAALAYASGPAGPTGATGAPGAAGTNGTNGLSVLNGTGAPAGSTGVDGDFYIDTAAWLIYGPKAAGVWGAGTSLIGSGMANPMTSAGDIIVGGAAGAPARLAVGGANTVLHGGPGPGYSAVLPADLDVSADNTTANATSTHHGLLPKLSGVSTDVLKGDGSWAAPSGGGGALVLLEQHTASNSATLDFTTAISAAYDEYLIEVLDLLPATAGAAPLLCVSTDGGSTFQASAYYWSQNNTQIGGATGGANGASNVSDIVLWGDSAGAGQGNGAANTFSGSFRLFNPLGTATYKYVRGEGLGHYNGNNSWYQFSMGGFWLATTAVNAFRVLYSSGNIASGTIRVYGIAKS